MGAAPCRAVRRPGSRAAQGRLPARVRALGLGAHGTVRGRLSRPALACLPRAEGVVAQDRLRCAPPRHRFRLRLHPRLHLRAGDPDPAARFHPADRGSPALRDRRNPCDVCRLGRSARLHRMVEGGPLPAAGVRRRPNHSPRRRAADPGLRRRLARRAAPRRAPGSAGPGGRGGDTAGRARSPRRHPRRDQPGRAGARVLPGPEPGVRRVHQGAARLDCVRADRDRPARRRKPARVCRGW